jgi:uncharacterized protein
MGLEWDPSKAASNLKKHGAHFADAADVLEDEHALTDVEDVLGEERLVSIGMDSIGRLLVVVYTHRGQNIRIISVRKATMIERAAYEEGL